VTAAPPTMTDDATLEAIAVQIEHTADRCTWRSLPSSLAPMKYSAIGAMKAVSPDG